jgi:ABC-type branched-subunit amino acid transport system ATPase component
MNVLVLENVSKSFDGIQAVKHVSLTLEAAKVTALIGPNGAGKTTLFNLISGFLRPDEGAIYYRDDDITGLAPWRIARKGIGRLFQDIHLFDRLKVKENVLAAFPRQSGENALRAILSRRRVSGEERSLNRRALELLDFVGLAHKAEELAENLSYGQQKLVAIARLLAADADTLLLDEPTAGVNPLMVQTLLDLIRRLALEGKAIALIEHNMNAITDSADRAYFIHNGQVVSFGSPAEVFGDPTVRTAYIGI